MPIREETIIERHWVGVPEDRPVTYYYSSDGVKHTKKSDAEQREAVIEQLNNFPGLSAENKDWPNERWFFIKDSEALNSLIDLHQSLYGKARTKFRKVKFPCFVKIGFDRNDNGPDEIFISDFLNESDIEDMVNLLRIFENGAEE